jgi:allantoin racemase
MKSIAVLGTAGGGAHDRVPPPIAEITGAGFTVDVVATRLGVFPATPEDRELAVLEYVEAGYRAEDRGFDAVFINTVGDYGLLPLRTRLAIPVFGAGEAAMLLASRLGRSFSIVTIWPPSMAFIYDAVLGDYGLTKRCASVRFVTSDAELPSRSGYMTEMVDQRRNIIDRVAAQCERAVAEDHCDSIVLGCTCMAPIAPQLMVACSVPVFEGMRIGYRLAEMTVDLGLHTKRSPQADQPSPTRQELEALLEHAATVHIPSDAPACELCADLTRGRP